MISFFKNILVIAPHPDDETLGVGGAIKKFTNNGAKVSLIVVGDHLPPYIILKII